MLATPASAIETVFASLVENSRQADSSEVRIGAYSEGDRVRVTVRDDGPA